jgi:hypothetical protein
MSASTAFCFWSVTVLLWMAPLTLAFTPSEGPSLATTTDKSFLTHRESFDRASFIQGWSTMETESCYELPGTFPVELKGTFFQNGPGKFK